MPTTKIASIHFAPFSARRQAYQGEYFMPAVPYGAEPFILEVEDRMQYDQGTYVASQILGQRQHLEYLITGEQIADDLIREWSQSGIGMSPTRRPGIWRVRDRVPVTNDDGTPKLDGLKRQIWRPATHLEERAAWLEDMDSAKRADYAYAQMLIEKKDTADAITDLKDPRKYGVWDNARAAAKHYNIKRSAAWMQEMGQGDMKTCLFCGELNRPEAVLCGKCQKVVDIERFVAIEEQQKREMKEAREQLRLVGA